MAKKSGVSSMMVVGIGLGLAIGISVGLATESLVVWIGIGICLGFAFGLALSDGKQGGGRRDKGESAQPSQGE